MGPQRVGHNLTTEQQQFIEHLNIPGGTVVKNPPANAGAIRDVSLIPELGRSPGEGNGNPFQCSFLRNPMDRGAWWATVHGGHEESDTT